MGCLLSQKRKHQLDQVAKIAVFKEIDSLMDIKIDKKQLKEKLGEGISEKNRHMAIDKPIYVESSELREINESQSQEISLSMGNMKKVSRRDVKIWGKVAKILCNIIYLFLREFPTNELSFLLSPINVLYMYLSSDVSNETRWKELAKVHKNKYIINNILLTYIILDCLLKTWMVYIRRNRVRTFENQRYLRRIRE